MIIAHDVEHKREAEEWAGEGGNMTSTILVQPASKGGYKYIKIKVDGDTVKREWGLAQGKTQITSNTYDALNVGKANEKSPGVVANEDYSRICKRKIGEGYREVTAAEFMAILRGEFREDHSAEMDVIDFDNPPKSFAVSKPIAKISDAKLQKLIDGNNAVIQTKENGLCHWIFVGSDKVIRLFTRRMDDHTEKYPDLIKYLNECKLPAKSVLACELVIQPAGAGHLADFKLVCGISRADTVKGELKFTDGRLPKTEERVKANPIRAMIFNILWWGGEEWHSKPYKDILGKLLSKFEKQDQKDPAYHPMSWPATKAAHIRKSAQDQRKEYEGYVVWDRNASVEVSFTGKPKRRACYKVKPTQEADVVVFSVESGKGKRQGKVASLNIGAYGKDGQAIGLGKCGSGLTNESAEISFWEDLPCVIQIEYAEQFETGKYQFPVFICKHGDKSPKEIVREEQ